MAKQHQLLLLLVPMAPVRLPTNLHETSAQYHQRGSPSQACLQSIQCETYHGQSRLANINATSPFQLHRCTAWFMVNTKRSFLLRKQRVKQSCKVSFYNHPERPTRPTTIRQIFHCRRNTHYHPFRPYGQRLPKVPIP